MDSQGWREKALLFGGAPHEYLREWEITADFDLVEEKLGVRLEEVSLDELLGRYTKLGQADSQVARRLAECLVSGASQPPDQGAPSLVRFEEATRLYLAMRALTDERRADAVTVTCRPFTRGPELPVPCVAVMLLQEAGIPAACQGDIDALLTMILFKRVTGRASFMGGGIEANGHLGVSHCVMSRQMAGPDVPRQPYCLADYHGRKASPTVFTGLPEGQAVTVARLTRNLEHLILTSGTVVDCRTLQGYCRNTLIIDVGDRSRVLGALKGVQQHLVVALGDHTRELAALAEQSGIEVLAV